MPEANLPYTGWRKATRSNANGGNCVEVGSAPNLVGVRDTKDRDGGTLAFDRSAWSAFTSALKDGRIGT